MRDSLSIRKYLFWMVDKMKGGNIRKHFSEIGKLLSDPEKQENLQIREDSLTHLLNHAVNTTKFYESFDSKNIYSFPIINKNIIRENFDDFRSSKYTEKDMISMVTSGSTGTPFKVYQDKNKKDRNTADTIYFAQKAGFEIGDKLFYLKIWSASNHKSNLVAKLQNVIPFDVFKLNDSEILRLLKLLVDSKDRNGVLSYASALEEVCKYLDVNGFDDLQKIKISSAITTSESLSDYAKTSFKKYFGIDVFARYSNLENGIIAQQFQNSGNSYLINRASYLLEIFKLEEDMLAEPGEMGRIVITDLYNYGMPLIRYDTGDIGQYALNEDGTNNISVLEHIEGRKLDLLYNTKGELVSSYIMYKNMWKYSEISQYQLIQNHKKEYIFKINVENDFAREEELVKEFKSYLGEDANFTVEYVAEIPLLSSGKRKKVVNNYYK